MAIPLKEQIATLTAKIEELEQQNTSLKAENKRLSSTASAAKVIIETFKEAAKLIGLTEDSHIENFLDRVKFLVQKSQIHPD